MAQPFYARKIVLNVGLHKSGTSLEEEDTSGYDDGQEDVDESTTPGGNNGWRITIRRVRVSTW